MSFLQCFMLSFSPFGVIPGFIPALLPKESGREEGFPLRKMKDERCDGIMRKRELPPGLKAFSR